MRRHIRRGRDKEGNRWGNDMNTGTKQEEAGKRGTNGRGQDRSKETEQKDMPIFTVHIHLQISLSVNDLYYIRSLKCPSLIS